MAEGGGDGDDGVVLTDEVKSQVWHSDLYVLHLGSLRVMEVNARPSFTHFTLQFLEIFLKPLKTLTPASSIKPDPTRRTAPLILGVVTFTVCIKVSSHCE